MHVGLCLELREGGCVLIGDVTRNIERRSRYHCCRDKAIYIRLHVCGLSYPACIAPCTVLQCHLWPGRLCHIFPTLSHKRHDFRGGGTIEHKMCVLTFYTMLP